jgi:hypothetical protein
LRVPSFYRACYGDNAFLAQFKFIVQNYLRNAVLIPKVKERYAAVVAYGFHPAGELYGLTGVFFPQFPASVCSVLVHVISLQHYN